MIMSRRCLANSCGRWQTVHQRRVRTRLSPLLQKRPHHQLSESSYVVLYIYNLKFQEKNDSANSVLK